MLFCPERSLSERVFLACLPVLVFGQSLMPAIEASAITVVFLLATVFFFVLFRVAFPPASIQTACLLWMAVGIHCLHFFCGIHGLWVLPVLILMPAEAFEKGRAKEALRRALLGGLGFFVVMCALAALTEVFTERLLFWSFKLPAGAFLLLALASFLWQNQPGSPTASPAREDA